MALAMGDVAGPSMAIPSDVLDFTQPCLPPTWEMGPRIPKPEAPDTGLCSRKWKLGPSRLCPSHVPSLNASSLFQSTRALGHPFRPNAVHSVSFKLDPLFLLFPRFLLTWPRPAPGEALPEPGSNPEKQPSLPAGTRGHASSHLRGTVRILNISVWVCRLYITVLQAVVTRQVLRPEWCLPSVPNSSPPHISEGRVRLARHDHGEDSLRL